ncbi:hypothetical protein BKA62DRAFT_398419 [Auriculariales sp. MPI-PUGE-AT-0066]|nr:hypothetical protein BKA62DRAFT_398419 [Auriculariales sp. MPI-PUGE-AT-0066]
MPKAKQDKRSQHGLFSTTKSKSRGTPSTAATNPANGQHAGTSAGRRGASTSALLANLASRGNPITTSDVANRTDHVGQIGISGHQRRDEPGVTMKHQLMAEALRASVDSVDAVCDIFRTVKAYVPGREPEAIRNLRLGQSTFVLDASLATHIVSDVKWQRKCLLSDSATSKVVSMQWAKDSIEQRKMLDETFYVTKSDRDDD